MAAAVAAGVLLLLLALSAIYTITAAQRNLFVAGPGFTNRLGYGIGTDFPTFYAAAVEARRGNAGSVYDMEALRAVHAEVRGVDVDRYAWAYPPTFLLLLLPLSLVALPTAIVDLDRRHVHGARGDRRTHRAPGHRRVAGAAVLRHDNEPHHRAEGARCARRSSSWGS